MFDCVNVQCKASLVSFILLNKIESQYSLYRVSRLIDTKVDVIWEYRWQLINITNNIIIYTWSNGYCDFSSMWAPVRDFLIDYRNVEREGRLRVVLFPYKIEDGSKTDNGSRYKVLSHHPRTHMFCRLGHPVDKADSCCIFRCRTDTHLSLQTSARKLWNFCIKFSCPLPLFLKRC